MQKAAAARKTLAEDAARARAGAVNRYVAIGAVIFYNLVGVLDIVSTIAAIDLGRGEEANPLMRAVMDHYGVGWIVAKLFLQGVISAMVLWFPHRIVIGLFLAAASLNAVIVLNNVRIALGA